ncbi:MAG: nucleoside deaminase [Methylovulum sp.]|nr:nucleoside deaminase [Methylovulum sp.]
MNSEYYMQKAIALASNAPDYPFGSVIVRRANGEIVAEGYNQSALNPIYHGEIVAICQFAQSHRSSDWHEFDLYTTAEPCPMCQSAIEWAGIATVYFGTSIPYLLQHDWPQINIRATEISAQTTFRNTRIIGGILENECNALFQKAPQLAPQPCD